MGQLSLFPHRYKITHCPQCDDITHISRNVIKVETSKFMYLPLLIIGVVIGALLMNFSKF